MTLPLPLQANTPSLECSVSAAWAKMANWGVAYRMMARHEEAITILKRVLIRKPDYLPAHANLLVAYSESGQEAEAQAEATAILRLSPQFSLEVWRQRLPFKDQAALERLLVGLRKAGLK